MAMLRGMKSSHAHVFISSFFVLGLSMALGCKPDPPKLEQKESADPVPVHNASQQPGQASSLTSPSASAQLPPGHPPVPGAAVAPTPLPTAGPAPAAAAGGLAGKVIETIPTAKYSYLKLETPTGEKWAAVPLADVKVGQEVTIGGASLMQNFRSPTLDRVFPEVWFGTLGGGAAAGHGAGATAGGGAAAPAGNGGAAAATAPAAGAAVPKAEGANAKTVAEVIGGRAALSGQPVAVRGRVVKFNAGILGRNWVHLQDGSGTPASQDNDLLVTTDETAEVGKIVTVTGTVAVDQDFGAGYSYAVLVEKATIATE